MDKRNMVVINTDSKNNFSGGFEARSRIALSYSASAFMSAAGR